MAKIINRIIIALILSIILFSSNVYADEEENKFTIKQTLQRVSITQKGMLLADYNNERPEEAFTSKKLRALDESDSEVIIEIDDELINGAVLELEYCIEIVEDKGIIDEILIENKLPNGFGYDSESQIIHLHKKNIDERWKLFRDEDNKVSKLFFKIKTLRSKGFKKYFTASRVLSIDTDVSRVINEATVTVKINGEKITKTSNSTKLSILPPLGKKTNVNYMLYLIIAIIISCIIIVYRRVYLKRINNT